MDSRLAISRDEIHCSCVYYIDLQHARAYSTTYVQSVTEERACRTGTTERACRTGITERALPLQERATYNDEALRLPGRVTSATKYIEGPRVCNWVGSISSVVGM